MAERLGDPEEGQASEEACQREAGEAKATTSAVGAVVDIEGWVVDVEGRVVAADMMILYYPATLASDSWDRQISAKVLFVS